MLSWRLLFADQRALSQKKKQKKKNMNNALADTLISDCPKHFSDLVAGGPSVKSEDLRFCAPFSAKFELKKLRMLAWDIFVEAFQTDHEFWLGNEQSRYPSRI